MREIKFRAWDDIEKEWLCIKQLGIMNNAIWYTQAIDENENDIDPPYFIDDKNVHLMQYTGRKDNTGVELYEGDVVEENDELSICVWMDEAGAFLFVPVYLYPCNLTTLTTNHGNDMFFDNDSPEIYVKIVGNIHEHPHLLKTKK